LRRSTQSATVSEVSAQRKLADTEAALERKKEEAERATNEAQRAKEEAQTARESEATEKGKWRGARPKSNAKAPKEGNPILASGCDNGSIGNDRSGNNRAG
jgi:hypothetical protein